MAKFILYFIFIFVIFSCNGQKENRTATIETDLVVETDTVLEKDTIAKDFLLGKFDYKSHTDFVKVDSRYSSKTLFIQKEVYSAFLDMRSSAAKDGINLIILSGTRNLMNKRPFGSANGIVITILNLKRGLIKLWNTVPCLRHRGIIGEQI